MRTYLTLRNNLKMSFLRMKESIIPYNLDIDSPKMSFLRMQESKVTYKVGFCTIKAIIILIPLIMASFSVFTFAQQNTSPSENFKKANEFYLKGNYTQAIDIYKGLISKGYESSDIYFNLANSYFKLKKISLSILYFEKAKKISPEDEDINYNLRVANLRVVDKIDPIPKFFLIQWYENLRDSFSSKSWSVFNIIFWWITLFSIAGFLVFWSPVMRRLFFGIAVISFTITIFTFIFANQQYGQENSKNTAIVFEPSVYIKNSPDDLATALFILHEGSKVQLLDKVNGWYKIRLANGNIGWLPESSVEVI
jgi:tetratricopeptide (TPR) repeat protein